MKKIVFAAIFNNFCGYGGLRQPNDNGVVEQDGPILESMDTGGHLEFNGGH